MTREVFTWRRNEPDGENEDTSLKALTAFCNDYQEHLARGGLRGTVRPNSPRYFAGGNKPGEVVRFLEDEGLVEIDEWPPDYALGGNDPQYVVTPTERGIGALGTSMGQGRLIIPPQDST